MVKQLIPPLAAALAGLLTGAAIFFVCAMVALVCVAEEVNIKLNRLKKNERKQ